MRVRRVVPCLVAAALLVGSAQAWSATSSVGRSRPAPLSHAGRWIVDPVGRVVIDHGFNMVDKRPPYLPSAVGFGTDDARFLAAHGFTAVRLGVLPEAVEPAPGRFDNGYLAGIARTVTLLGRYGIRSLLDLHQDQFNERYQGEGFPAWMANDNGIPPQPRAGFPGDYVTMPALWRVFDNLWADTPGPGAVGPRERVARMWVHIARYFRGNPDVLGYDVFNEPYPGSDFASCFPPAGCPRDDTARLVPFERALIDAIHIVDPTHLAFYEPWLMFDYGAPTALGKFADAMSGMSFHDYCLATLNAPETTPTRSACDVGVEQRVMANALAQAKTSGDALLLTEFGSTSDETEFAHMLRLADGNAMPWLEWAYCFCSDPTGGGPGQGIVYDPRKPPTGANVNAARLASLDEPHPYLVAGTPVGFRYDARARTFTFRYSTTPATGRALPPDASTWIWVGRLHYPHGYTARVIGALVTSSRSGPWLTVVATPGQHDVAVTVTPMG